MSEPPEDASSARKKSPWGWRTIIVVSFLGSFVAGGIIAGLNWWRMEQHRLMLPTIIISTIGWVLVFAIWGMLFGASSIATIIGYLVNVVVAWALWSWQKGAYHEWKNMNPDAQKAGWLVPLAATLISIGVYLFALGV